MATFCPLRADAGLRGCPLVLNRGLRPRAGLHVPSHTHAITLHTSYSFHLSSLSLGSKLERGGPTCEREVWVLLASAFLWHPEGACEDTDAGGKPAVRAYWHPGAQRGHRFPLPPLEEVILSGYQRWAQKSSISRCLLVARPGGSLTVWVLVTVVSLPPICVICRNNGHDSHAISRGYQFFRSLHRIPSSINHN